MSSQNLYARLGISTTFDRSHKFVTSPFIQSPFVLGGIRLTLAVYTLVTLLVVLIWESVKDHDADSFFSYFTHLSYIGLCAYYFAAAIQAFSYALAWRKSGAGAGYILQRWPRLLQALHVVLQATIVSFPILVTIVFWALLSDSTTFASTFSSWSNISVHALNSVFALFEIIFTNSPPPPWLTLPFCILILAGYIGVAYITHATQGFYTYSFLDPQKEGAKLAAYIIGIAVGEILIFILIRYVICFRERWAEKHGKVLHVNSGIDGEEVVSGDEEWEEVERPSGPQQKGEGDAEMV